MKLLGEPLLARDETGRLKSRIGTIFLRTPGLVTLTGIHATQRLAWIRELNRERLAAEQPKLTNDEFDAEISHSVDLLFDDQFVLIRPDPNAMDLAFEADELLQALVSKRKIRFLNTQHEKVRNALRARGENWRMSRIPVSPEEMTRLIANSRVSIAGFPLYFYNRSTGTRFLTRGDFAWLASRPDDIFRTHLDEIAQHCALRNRFGHPEIDIFPPGCAFTRQAFEALNVGGLSIAALRSAYEKLLAVFRQSVPDALMDETPENIEWRNLMCSTLIMQPNAISADELIQGISPEFYMQIEWLPGCRIEEGELIFDSVCEELDAAPDDPDLNAMCDPRAKAVIFNYLREFGTIEFINIGRISRSLSTRVQVSQRRTNVYIVQVKEADKPNPELRILRFQKWGLAEHLDEGKDLIQSIMEAVDYTDYILDRRLGCRQLGMNLPVKVTTGRMPETYYGLNKTYHGARCWAIYFERNYINGYATDKILTRCYADPEFNRRFARLLGEAAAVNCIVGRANSNKDIMFDDGDEVLVLGADGMPDHLIVSDHTGAFTQYEFPLSYSAKAYAAPVNRRARLMSNAAEFADLYLASFSKQLARIQLEYLRRQRAFDKLFKHRPLDKAGSFAYRWQCVLARLASADAATLTKDIRRHIAILSP
jgi:hypothetical protein